MRAVVLTGASRGLGAAFFETLFKRGDKIMGLARSFPADQRTLAEEHPDRVQLKHIDLAAGPFPAPAEIEAFGYGAEQAILINNAATVEPIGAVGTLAAASIETAIAVNLAAPMILTNIFLAAVKPLDARVRVLFVTSSAAQNPKPGTSLYSATKAGGEAFFVALRAELAGDPRFGVHVVDPGGMDTDMHATLRSDAVSFPDQERLRRVAAEGRLGSPVAVAHRILRSVGLD
jgi:NAD(P)-dependent dehydrogenase (short-subunit alcohol dehydrogenase family)